MSDPRIVEPQRAVPPAPEAGCGDDHVYWCWKRITGAVLLGLLLVAAVAGLVWWLR